MWHPDQTDTSNANSDPYEENKYLKISVMVWVSHGLLKLVVG